MLGRARQRLVFFLAKVPESPIHFPAINRPNFRNFTVTTTKQQPSPNEERLTGRIFSYLNTGSHSGKVEENRTHVELLNSIIFNENPGDGLQYLSADELAVLFSSLKAFRNKWEFQKALNVLDLECCARLSSLRHEHIFKLLCGYMLVIPNHIIRYKFYNMALFALGSKLEKLDRNGLMKFLFYVSLQKKTRDAQALVKKCLATLKSELIETLNIDELVVICNSTFRTSTKITNDLILDKVKNYINNNLGVLKDAAIFITLVKTLRQHRRQDEDLLASISCAIFFNKTHQYYSFGALCHILALYSDYLYYDDALLDHFCSVCLAELETLEIKSKRLHLTKYVRAKDIKRFLWALSNLGYGKIEHDVFESVIEPKILDKVHAGEFKNDAESLIEILLYLWTLKYQALDLLPFALEKKRVAQIRDKKSMAKYRLNLLLSCIYFENRQLYKSLNLRQVGGDNFDLNSDVRKRPLLRRIHNSLKLVGAKIEVNKFELNYQVPYLNIVGITGYRKSVYKAVNIEVLDGYVCAKNVKSHPSGPMQLKLRILDGLEEALIVIREEEMESITESELQDYLLEELEFVCL